MCHPNVPVFPLGDPGRRSRWRVLPAMGIGSTADVEPPAREAAREASSSGGATRQCVCSPTSHAGSFRCRLHIAEYVWRSRCAR
ncbi:hypothetical protein BT93_C0620 [Corymbia citriodora subsp. variegata]|nr:hypothetical protein BT93_C0620 [Corymbia citriodora subsp. variegata]